MGQPNYYTNIPAFVRYDEELLTKPKSILLYGEIVALSNKKGYCWATNAYFASSLKVSARMIQSYLDLLVKKKYVARKLIYKAGTKQVDKRILSIDSRPGETDFMSPGETDFAYNITSINTTSKNKDDDDRTRAHGENSAEKTFSLLNEYQLRQFKQGGHLTKLLSMVDEFGDDLVAWAIQQTVDSASSPNWNYFARVIQRIQENNVHSVKEAVNLSKQHSEKLKHRGKVPRQPTKSKPNDVPDWLKQGQNMTPEERAEWQAKALQEELAKGDNA